MNEKLDLIIQTISLTIEIFFIKNSFLFHSINAQTTFAKVKFSYTFSHFPFTAAEEEVETISRVKFISSTY